MCSGDGVLFGFKLGAGMSTSWECGLGASGFKDWVWESGGLIGGRVWVMFMCNK